MTLRQRRSSAAVGLSAAVACLLLVSPALLLGAPSGAGETARPPESAQVAVAITVLGPVPAERLGPTLMHEHLFIDWFEGVPRPKRADDVSEVAIRRMQQAGWEIPWTAEQKIFFNRPDLTLDMIDRLRRAWRLRTNYLIDDEALEAREVRAFQELGGRTVVDVTPYGMGRDPVRLRRFALRTGLNIVMGTGWYRWPFQPPAIERKSVEELADIMVSDIERGDANGIRAGIIGEIPVDSRSIRIAAGAHPSDQEVAQRSTAARRRLFALSVGERDLVDPAAIYDPAELKLLAAAARASRRTGAALSIHGVDPWIGYLKIVEREGADLHRTIIGHADFILADPELLAQALSKGVVLEVDYRLQYYASQSPVGDVDALVKGIVWAVEHGHRDQILLSLDLCNKQGLLRYGGGGYATLHHHILPKLRAAGLTEADIEQILVVNPRRLLTLAAPRQ
jgi:phosphotriesterase-related protein